MARARHILVIGDLQKDKGRFVVNNTRMFAKGFTRRGADVVDVSYRQLLEQKSGLGGKRLSRWLGKDKADATVAELGKHHESDLVFISDFKAVDEATVVRLKEAVPKARVVCWYGDLRADTDKRVAAIGRHCDWFLSTSGGEVLRRYQRAGARNCAFMPNPCDADCEGRREVGEEWRSKVLFVGKLRHKQGGQDPLRDELVRRLYEAGRLTLWGDMGRPAVHGLDFLRAIWGCETALSINAFNDVRLYHSDRLIRYLANGAFTVAKRVPDSELLFADGEQVVYFDTAEECEELLERYEREAEERERIGSAGQRRAQEAFGCEKLAGHVLELVEEGEYKEAWAEVLTG